MPDRQRASLNFSADGFKAMLAVSLNTWEWAQRPTLFVLCVMERPYFAPFQQLTDQTSAIIMNLCGSGDWIVLFVED